MKLCALKDWTRDDGTRYVIILYKTNKFTGELTSSDEGEVEWVPFSKLSGMNLSSGMKPTLHVFQNENITELFFRKENDGNWVEIFK